MIPLISPMRPALRGSRPSAAPARRLAALALACVPAAAIHPAAAAAHSAPSAPPLPAAPVAPPEAPPPTWQLTVSPFADLWYGGLAALGYEGPGPYAWHEPAIEAPAVARVAPEVGRAFRADPAFEVLHFVPVYLVGAGVTEALEALAAVASAPPASTHLELPPTARTHGTAELLAALLPRRAQREALGRFVEALAADWAATLRADWTARQPDTDARLQALQDRWTIRYAPALAPYLASRGLEGGLILLSRPLGPQGRVFTGDAFDPTDNVVAVGLRPASEGPDATLAPAVRELCFPAVREAFPQVQDRYADDARRLDATERAATVCGALLLERTVPEALDAYRRRYGSRAGGPSPDASSLPGVAPGDEALVEALERVLDTIETRTPPAGAGAPRQEVP